MPKVRFICLANSRKNNGRCVAGICTDNQCWIRPVSSLKDGTLNYEYKMSNGAEAALFDEIEVELISPKPVPHQPENWLVGLEKWNLIQKIPTAYAIRLLEPFLFSGPTLFGNYKNCVPHANLRSQPAKESLILIEPDTIYWLINKNYYDQRQIRCKFNFRGMPYNLVVTDPVFEHRFSKLDYGDYSHNDVGITSTDRVILTISLAEPLKDKCYKLVAAVLILPK